ncbi:tRNA (adenosine(37)-N6)-dimethylallyltransferase MiaA [Pontibacter sp. BT310]|uniref:tRNA dimethylallyltransferase n=1 Tax=Pontibacter populi TaxID=890055 RepID=A0ABS6X6F7_9BACT|nr:MULTISPECIES: tRNA (adenosine(37)-N6)-dimethylallyltransferase MiaA [Pontibacter]MBJ6116724.1 tRNA (adenosine(37)-N6)-dimethylallyltransferase MiaA [Pontibacter sp. BT310]MBR0569148.1 tRNA (adenosine(37)-N6)-dimethylallyltransferase MiaA [Microvirga sp. STS03]MBW3363578.1 tRNA (adenosine(37)-N6)-dimethylallyltransferase MiaA [Pontibacter populi]
MGKDKFVVVVVGPTAVGKTDLCVNLAAHFSTEVVSADSRQFYKEMQIGTAKPTIEEQQGVPHHFVNSHSIAEEYNAGAYEQDALQLLNTLFKEHDVVIVTGGSGLYVRALCEGMDEMPETDPAIRAKLTAKLESEGLEPLVNHLKSLDPEYYNQVDKANPQRVVRALEVCLSSGQPYSSFRKWDKTTRPFKIIKIGLTRDRQELYDRIDQRMDQMLQQGLLEEAKALYPFRTHNALQTVGYKEIFDCLEGKYDWEEAVRLLKRNSRRYAKRQLTWFTKHPDEYTWFHPQQWEEIVSFIVGKLRS